MLIFKEVFQYGFINENNKDLFNGFVLKLVSNFYV